MRQHPGLVGRAGALAIAVVSASLLSTAALGATPPTRAATTVTVDRTPASDPRPAELNGALSPALNGWTAMNVVDPSGSFTSAAFAVTGGKRAVLAYQSSRTSFVRTSTDSGRTWSSARQLSPSGKKVVRVTMAASGARVSVLSQTTGGLFVRSSTDGGSSWGSSRTVPFPYAQPAIARGPGNIVALIGLDSGRLRWKVKVSTDGGTSWGPARTVGSWELTGGDVPPPSIAVAGSSIVVLFKNANQDLVARRSTDRGASWSTAKVLETDASLVAALAANGATVIAAYSQDPVDANRLVVRRSTNGGSTWSAPTLFGTDLVGLAVGFGQGAWRLVTSDTTGAWRYRSSPTGASWSSPLVIDTGHGDASQPIGVGAFNGGPVAGFQDTDQDLWVVRD